jgi:hypothetical protein
MADFSLIVVFMATNHRTAMKEASTRAESKTGAVLMGWLALLARSAISPLHVTAEVINR